MNDSSLLKKILDREIRNINTSLVKSKKKLSVLMDMEKPEMPTVSGGTHFINRSVIEMLAVKLPEELKSRLNLPMTFYYNPEVEDSYYLTDPAVLEVLQVLGELDRHYSFNKGRLWFSKPLGNDMSCRYPGLIQFMIVPGR